jgi:hypothetical protein
MLCLSINEKTSTDEQKRLQGLKVSAFHSSFSAISKVGISTWHGTNSTTGCYGVTGPIPSAVLDKSQIIFKNKTYYK